MEKFNDIVVVGSYVRPYKHDVIYGMFEGDQYCLERGRFLNNGLKGFSSLDKAQRAFGEVICRGVRLLDHAFYARLELQFAQKDEDLSDRGPYVVVARRKKSGLYLLGAKSQDIVSVLSPHFTDLELNGLKPVWERDVVLSGVKDIRKRGAQAVAAAIQFDRIG